MAGSGADYAGSACRGGGLDRRTQQVGQVTAFAGDGEDGRVHSGPAVLRYTFGDSLAIAQGDELLDAFIIDHGQAALRSLRAHAASMTSILAKTRALLSAETERVGAGASRSTANDRVKQKSAPLAAGVSNVARKAPEYESADETSSAVLSPGTWDGYDVAMLKGEDIVLLLKLSGNPRGRWTIRELEDETTIPRSVVQRARKRLGGTGLLDERRAEVNLSQAEEFLIHALRYVFPARVEGESRGVPTAWAAEPLSQRISSPPGELPPVWPDSRAKQRGLAVPPLHASAVEAARRDQELGERLALVDAIRLGDARIRGVASELLADRLRAPVAWASRS